VSFYAHAQGDVFSVKANGDGLAITAVGGGPRGTISEFSKASRRRMIDFIARLELKGVRTTFLTLTFAGTPINADAKISLKRFLQWMRRAHAGASGIWRMELQARGAIHFHLILFNFPYVEQKKLQARWERCTGEEKSIVHIKLLDGKRAAMAYVSKYVAKATPLPVPTSLDRGTYQHAGGKESVGRMWGYLNRAALPIAQIHQIIIEDEDLFGYARFACRARSGGRCGRHENSAKLYCSDAEKMLIWLVKHAGGTFAADGIKPQERFGALSLAGVLPS